MPHFYHPPCAVHTHEPRGQCLYSEKSMQVAQYQFLIKKLKNPKHVLRVIYLHSCGILYLMKPLVSNLYKKKKKKETYPNTASHPLHANSTKTISWMAKTTPNTIKIVKPAGEKKNQSYLKWPMYSTLTSDKIANKNWLLVSIWRVNSTLPHFALVSIHNVSLQISLVVSTNGTSWKSLIYIKTYAMFVLLV